MIHNSETNPQLKPTKRQKYQYAVTAILVIIIASTLMLSYVAVTFPLIDALNKISINNITYQEVNLTTPALVSFSTGNWTLNFSQGYLNITNTGDKDLILNLVLSATVTDINTEHTNYNLGSVTISNVTAAAHSSTIISATLKDTLPIVNWTQKPSGYWGISWSIHASAEVNYLLSHPAFQKTFQYQGQMMLY